MEPSLSSQKELFLTQVTAQDVREAIRTGKVGPEKRWKLEVVIDGESYHPLSMLRALLPEEYQPLHKSWSRLRELEPLFKNWDSGFVVRPRANRRVDTTSEKPVSATTTAEQAGESHRHTKSGSPRQTVAGQKIVDHVLQSLAAEGLDFSREQVADFYLAVRTKPFVLLAGISGTGKSILARRFAAACGFQAPLIAVRPDWSDPSELLGYRDLEGAFVPGRLIPHLVAAAEKPERPYFVILDEMNLARVEHYFADLLSVMETRRTVENRVLTDILDLDIGPETVFRCDDGLAKRLREVLVDRGLTVPSNLCVVGTVNMDESTHPFSKKVLDRAMTLEFVTVDLRAVPVRQEPPTPISVGAGDLDAPHLSLSEVYAGREAFFQPAIELLVELNEILAKASMQVGYRTRDEVCLFLFHNAEQVLLDERAALDLAVYHKVLPRLQGGEEIRRLLQEVHQVLSSQQLSRCERKIDKMQQRLELSGFTAFWA